MLQRNGCDQMRRETQKDKRAQLNEAKREQTWNQNCMHYSVSLFPTPLSILLLLLPQFLRKRKHNHVAMTAAFESNKHRNLALRQTADMLEPELALPASEPAVAADA